MIAAGALPRAVLMLGGGVVADRFGPRRIAIASDTTRCVAILAAAAAIVLAAPGVALLVPIALIFGAVDALFMPAVGALPPRIVAPGQLARLQGMRGLSIRQSNAVGPGPTPRGTLTHPRSRPVDQPGRPGGSDPSSGPPSPAVARAHPPSAESPPDNVSGARRPKGFITATGGHPSA